jgi:glycosyltransferase involved in cell wall biosynthesis
MEKEYEVTVLMPCLNEAENICECISEADLCLKKNGINGEILISDNGSADDSVKLAQGLGARVIHCENKGYGNALRFGIKNAFGKYIIMGDCDGTYDFSELMPYIEDLRKGISLVMGDRLNGKIEKGAMPFSHRYLGVPFLSMLARCRFKTDIHDFHCGLRGINKADFDKLNLDSEGMEFASEMIGRAMRAGYSYTQHPASLRKRHGKSHLHAFRDGMRHIHEIFSI